MKASTTILVDCTNTYSGGAKTHLREVFMRIPADTGGTVYTFVGARDILGALPDEKDHIVKRTARLLNRGPLGRYIWRIFCLPTLVRKYDLVFFPGGTVVGRPRRSVTMSRNMLPLMREEYSNYGFSKYYFKIELLRILQRRSFQRASGIIFLSEFAREMVSAELGRFGRRLRDRSMLIPHGITEGFRDVQRSRQCDFQYACGTLSLLYISSFDVYKNQETVLLAVDKLRDKGMDVNVRFVGPRNPLAFTRFEKVRDRLDPSRKWSFVDVELTQSELRDLYATSDVFIYASTCENLPNILLEAMAARIPIVCSDSRPMSDILGGGGWYFVPRDANSLATAIEATVNAAESRQTMVDVAYDRAAVYDWDSCARDTLEYLREIGHT